MLSLVSVQERQAQKSREHTWSKLAARLHSHSLDRRLVVLPYHESRDPPLFLRAQVSIFQHLRAVEDNPQQELKFLCIARLHLWRSVSSSCLVSVWFQINFNKNSRVVCHLSEHERW